MALLFCEGFDSYASTSVGSTAMAQVWSSFVNNYGSAQIGAYGRNSSLGYYGNGSDHQAVKTLASNYGTLIAGTAFKRNIGTTILAFMDGGTTQIDLRENSSGQIAVYRGGTLLDTTAMANPLVGGVWAYVEAKVVFHGSTGSVVVRVNGITQLTLTNINTSASGNAYASGLRIGNGTGTYCSWDDIYIADTTGSFGNDFFGDIRVDTIMPSGNGNSSQLVGSDSNSTDNYLLVDEIGYNGDTDYVGSATAGDKDTYAFADLATSAGTVYGVQIHAVARKDDAGSRSIVTVARLSTTEEDGSVFALSDSYASAVSVRTTKPGGGQWTVSDVNSAEFGIKINA